ncbi:MAG: 7-cyano-7-deazaguanine synthase [Gemmataceae bacterium]
MTPFRIKKSVLPPAGSSLAVLASGGLDSAILVGEALRAGICVHPLYVRCGFYWEKAEHSCLERYLKALPGSLLRPLHLLEMPITDVYEAHWSLTGRDVPNADSPDEAVYLPGRNILLLSKALLWCRLHELAAIALAPLAGNPFADATPAFFQAYESVVNQAINGRVRILCPYAEMSKQEVMRRAQGLPLDLTFSCIRPVSGHHCGRCNKCAERRRAFRDAGIADATVYDWDFVA